jgi:biopolymer transport protein ExbB
MLRFGMLTAIGAPVVGVVATGIGMVRAFQTLGTSGHGDPSKVSVPVGEVLIPCFVGVPAGLIGLVIAITARRKICALKSDSSSDAAP